MKLRTKILPIIILTCLTASAQKKTLFSLGTNIPPIIGNTFTLSAELITPKYFTANLEIGIMHESKLQGSFHEIGTGRDDHINSGQYISIGIRFTPRKSLNQTYFFVGIKTLGGYFNQSAEIWDDFETFFRDEIIPHDYEIKGNRVYSEGFFVGLAGDIGINVKVSNRFNLEFGIQGGHHVYTSKRQVDNVYSYLPGMGALNVVGIIKTKIIIGKIEN